MKSKFYQSVPRSLMEISKEILSKSPAAKTDNKEDESSLILHSSGLFLFTHLRPVCPSDLSPGPLFSILTLRLAWKNF